MIVFPMTYSLSTIERRFVVVSKIHFAGFDAELLWDKDRLIACVVACEVDDKERRQVIASIEMEKTTWKEDEAFAVERYWEQDINQIRGVVVKDQYQEFGLATMMYETLVLDLGMIVVSDNEQYIGGKSLWKHIASTSTLLKVFVFDSASGEFYPFNSSECLEYDGNNIDDTVIWSLDPDHSRREIVLIAET